MSDTTQYKIYSLKKLRAAYKEIVDKGNDLKNFPSHRNDVSLDNLIFDSERSILDIDAQINILETSNA